MNYAFLLGVSALAGASAASAQDVGGWTADTIVVTGVRESYAEPQAATATRTATPIEQVPQSIQVLTRSLIDEQQLKTLTDALVNVSGVERQRQRTDVEQRKDHHRPGAEEKKAK